MNQPSSCSRSRAGLLSILRGRPQAAASLSGGMNHPGLSGTVQFYQTREGVIVYADISGLPRADRPYQARIFGFHIHEGADCGGSMDDAFADAMSHYNPGKCEHPCHAQCHELKPQPSVAPSFFRCLQLVYRFSIDNRKPARYNRFTIYWRTRIFKTESHT